MGGRLRILFCFLLSQAGAYLFPAVMRFVGYDLEKIADTIVAAVASEVKPQVTETNIQTALFGLVTLAWVVVFFWPFWSRSGVAWIRLGQTAESIRDRMRFFGSGMLPMHEVARRVYDATRDTEIGKFVERNFDDPDQVLRVLARHIVGTGIDIFGKRPAGAELRKIDKEIFKSGAFRAAGSQFCLNAKHVPEYLDISIRQRDLKKAVAEIKTLSEAMPQNDGYI